MANFKIGTGKIQDGAKKEETAQKANKAKPHTKKMAACVQDTEAN